MKNSRLAFVICAFFLASCAYKDVKPELDGFNPDLVRQPQPTRPNLFVVDRRLVVDQEPIRIGKGELGADGRVTIRWSLSARGPHTFTDNGIRITPGPNKDRDTPRELRCNPLGAQRKVFECSYRPLSGRSIFKYTINAQNQKNPAETIEPLDPIIETNV